MPRPARPWFRFYVEALSDRKLRRLTPAQRWLWVAVLGAARMSPEPGVLLVAENEPMDEHDLADIAAMPVRDVEKALPLFERAGMLHRDDAGAWVVTNWSGRQYESDNVTARTRKHRSKEHGRNVPTNVPTSTVGTDQKTETDTDTENPPSSPPSESPSATAQRGTRIPEPFTVTADMRDWVERECAGLDWRRETEQFVDYWRAATGQKATKRDWPATWRTWMRRAAAAHTHQPRPVGNEPPRLPVYEPREVPDALPRNELAERARTLRVVRR